ncbi:MAG: class II aldolase/adducin family protein [bacterium]|jgi:L-fuculose-phosphate aldolase|nr:class II aldolase/adducin family protein [bacterium]
MMNNRHLLHPRDEIMQTMERIYRYRMTTTSGGNLSLRDGEDIWITPARVDKGTLRRDDIVCVKADGTVVGPHPPSSEFPFHRAIYQARPDIQGIVHAHPVALVAFSIGRDVPNTRLFHQARHVCGEVVRIPYALPGSEALAEQIATTFRQGAYCAIMQNHGVVIGSESLQSAFQRFETLEFTAKTIIKASHLGPVHYLNDEQIALPRQTAVLLPEFTPGPASSEEKDLRRQLCQFVRRGYQQRLLISTEGSFSARVDAQSFLITPYQVDRNRLDLEDLVLVRDGQREEGKIPSRANRNHAAIYRLYPQINAIVNAYTVNATAFSVTGAALDTRTIPESYIFLRDAVRIPYGVQFQDSSALAAAISPTRPIALLANDGVLVVGKSVLDTFDRLEVLESTAEALINCRPLGSVSPMDDGVIEELRAAFFPTD